MKKKKLQNEGEPDVLKLTAARGIGNTALLKFQVSMGGHSNAKRRLHSRSAMVRIKRMSIHPVPGGSALIVGHFSVACGGETRQGGSTCLVKAGRGKN